VLFAQGELEKGVEAWNKGIVTAAAAEFERRWSSTQNPTWPHFTLLTHISTRLARASSLFQSTKPFSTAIRKYEARAGIWRFCN